jgi:Dna[CI] antecedent DciA-like protein
MSWHPERIAGAVRVELNRAGVGGPVADVVAAWPAAVGPAVAANAWPARLGRDGTLHVAVSASVWAFELTQLEETVRERLRDCLGGRAPARLRFFVGAVPDRPPEAVATCRRNAPEVSAEARSAGQEIAAAIENEDLRALAARAVAASLQKTRKRR